MQIIKYLLTTEINRGTPEKPDIEISLTPVEMPYNETNYQTALAEAYNGEVTIEDDGQPEPGPTIAERMDSLEAAIERGLTL